MLDLPESIWLWEILAKVKIQPRQKHLHKNKQEQPTFPQSDLILYYSIGLTQSPGDKREEGEDSLLHSSILCRPHNWSSGFQSWWQVEQGRPGMDKDWMRAWFSCSAVPSINNTSGGYMKAPGLAFSRPLLVPGWDLYLLISLTSHLSPSFVQISSSSPPGWHPLHTSETLVLGDRSLNFPYSTNKRV